MAKPLERLKARPARRWISVRVKSHLSSMGYIGPYSYVSNQCIFGSLATKLWGKIDIPLLGLKTRYIKRWTLVSIAMYAASAG